MNRNSPVFILGYPRSGTTLLRAMLGAHPDIKMINEPELIYGLYRAGYSVESLFHPEHRQLVLSGLREFKLTRSHLETLPQAATDAFLSRPGVMTFKEVYESLLPRPEDSLIWGEKSLNNSFLMPILVKLYPNALIVNVMRDARSSILSNYNKVHVLSKKNEGNAESQLPRSPRLNDLRFFTLESMKWKTWMQILERETQSVSGNLLVVKYEDLLVDPETVLGRICQRIGLSLDARMISPETRKDDPVLRTDSSVIHKKLSEPLDQSRATAYRRLPPWAIYTIESHTRPLLQCYEYEPSGIELPLRDRVRYMLMSLISNKGLRAKVETYYKFRRFSPPRT